ncbi:MAG: HDOD domain-containing protein [Kofleriaceae bacterium]
MLGWLTRLFRRQPPVASVPMRAPRVPITAEGSGPVKPVTTASVIEELAESLGGPLGEVDTAFLHPMARCVVARGETISRPPSSFPLVASQMMSMLRDPALDLNRLVGAVQRDAGIATALLKLANSPVFAPAVPINSLRGAVSALGVQQVGRLVIANAGRTLYDVPKKSALDMYPDLWNVMFHDAMANAFTAGRLALDVRGANSELSLIAGLVVDAGRPVGLQIICELVEDGMARPNDVEAMAILDEVTPALGSIAVRKLKLPTELEAACVPDAIEPTIDGHIARLVSAIGGVQRRTPRIGSAANDVAHHADKIGLAPYQVRAQFGSRESYLAQARAFG